MNGMPGGTIPDQQPQEKVGMAEAAGLIRWLFRRTGASFRLLAFIMVSCAVSTLIAILLPSLIGRVIDSLADPLRTARSLTALAALHVFAAALGISQGLAIPRLTQRISHRLRRLLYARLLRLPIWEADAHPHGDYMSRLTNDTENVVQTLSQVIPSLITTVLTLLGCLWIMLRISPRITAWNLGIAAAAMLPCSLLSRHVFEAARNQQKELGRLNAEAENCLLRRRSILLAGCEEAACRQVSRAGEDFVGAAVRMQILSGVMEPMMILIGSGAFILTIAIGVEQIGAGILTVGMLQACLVYARQLLRPFQEGGRIMAQLQGCMAALVRIRELCDKPVAEVTGDDAPAVTGRMNRQTGTRTRKAAVTDDGAMTENGEARITAGKTQAMGIRFRDVHFSYVRGRELYAGLNLEIPAGRTTAVTGETGAGKTTLLNLLLRFYRPDSGQVLLGEIPVEEWNRKRLYHEIAVILQDEVTTAETVYEYASYGIPGKSREEVMEALRAVYADHIVRALPRGLDTRLTEGDLLSRGQMQLIALARVPLSGAGVLILDEATSSVDSCTERMLQEAFEKLRAGRTCIVIAHRPSTIRSADRVLLVKNGQIRDVTEASGQGTVPRRSGDGSLSRSGDGSLIDLINADQGTVP